MRRGLICKELGVTTIVHRLLTVDHPYFYFNPFYVVKQVIIARFEGFVKRVGEGVFF
jgi:hypothetical protein